MRFCVGECVCVCACAHKREQESERILRECPSLFQRNRLCEFPFSSGAQCF